MSKNNIYLEKIASLEKTAANRLTKEIVKSFKSGRMDPGSDLYMALTGVNDSAAKSAARHHSLYATKVDLDSGEIKVSNFLRDAHLKGNAELYSKDSLDPSQIYRKAEKLRYVDDMQGGEGWTTGGGHSVRERLLERLKSGESRDRIRNMVRLNINAKD